MKALLMLLLSYEVVNTGQMEGRTEPHKRLTQL